MDLISTEIGYFGPLFLLLILTIKIKSKNKLLLLLLFSIINEVTNRLLKHIIKQPRPRDIKYINTWDCYDEGSYGMPSGHSQNIAAAATVLILYTKNIIIAIYAVLQTLLTMYQRYYYKKHTKNQIFCGGVLGIIMGVIYYAILKKDAQTNYTENLTTPSFSFPLPPNIFNTTTNITSQ